MLPLLLTTLSWAGHPVHCATPHTYAPVRAPAWLPPPDDHKEGRDAYALPNAATSENFALRWGSDIQVTEEQSAALLEMLETAWVAEVDGLDHPPPVGSDSFLFNVYLGSSGDGAPSTLGAAGYYAPDREELPMLVLDPGLLEDDPEYLAMTVAHELYHALQAVSDRYAFEEGAVGTWYWEATAVWASAEVYPEYALHAEYLFGYALLHQEPVDLYDYFDGNTQGELSEFYSYGAFAFPLDLVLAIDDPSLVPDSWKDTSTETDPLKVLSALLEARGEDLDALWMRHNARMVTYDHPLGEEYERLVKGQFQYDEQDDRVVGRITSPTAPGSELQPPNRLTPKRYGFNVYEIDLNDPQPTRLTVRGFDGSSGSAGTFHAELVQVSDDTPRYERVAANADGLLSTDVDPSQWDEAYLVIGVTTADRADDWAVETFGYAITVEPALDEEDDGGCGCSVATSPGLGSLAWLAWVAPLVAARRRRSRC